MEKWQGRKPQAHVEPLPLGLSSYKKRLEVAINKGWRLKPMAIKEYDYVNDPNAKCSQCGTHEDIVIDENGDFICTDCLFESHCKQYDDEYSPPSPWVFGKDNDE